MHFKSSLDEERIRTQNPIDLMCHAIGKLRMVSTIICDEDSKPKGSGYPFEVYRQGEVYALGEIVDFCADDIEFLAEIAGEKRDEESDLLEKAGATIAILREKNAKLEKTLEQYRLRDYDGDDIVKLGTFPPMGGAHAR